MRSLAGRGGPSALYGPDLFAFFADGERLRAWVDAQGAFAPLAMVALDRGADIVAAVLPGEPLELGAGYIFGFWEGTALCMAAGLVGTFIVVTLVRTLGMKAVELFFSREKIESMKWLQDSARFELLMFVCFLIPGTPKDVMTYVAGLTRCPVWRIALITTVGRIPSIVSSTMAAGFARFGRLGGERRGGCFDGGVRSGGRWPVCRDRAPRAQEGASGAHGRCGGCFGAGSVEARRASGCLGAERRRRTVWARQPFFLGDCR